MLGDTLLIDGVDVQSVAGIHIADLSGLLRDGPYRGENVTLPNRPGEIGVYKVRGPYSFDVPITVLCEDSGGIISQSHATRRAQFVNNLDAVRFLCATNLVTLTRVMSGRANATCNAEYVPNAAIDMLNTVNGRTVLQFVNLDGGWS